MCQLPQYTYCMSGQKANPRTSVMKSSGNRQIFGPCSSAGKYQCHPYDEARWWQHQATVWVGRLSSRNRDAGLILGNRDYIMVFAENTAQEGTWPETRGSPLSMTAIRNIQPRRSWSGFCTSHWLSLRGPAKAHLWGDLKMAVHRGFPSNLTEL